jgi:hypothetical protein
MHDALFAGAARPARYVILGLPMKSYSIGHELLLLESCNPILFNGFDSLDKVTQRQAAIRASLICSQDWCRNHRAHRWLKLWRWKNRNADYPLAIAYFRNFRKSGSLFPPTPDKEADGIANGPGEKKGRELGGPYLARLYNFVAAFPASEIKIHGKTAFDFPMGLANFLYLTNLECDGDLKIENAKEAEIKQEMIDNRAKIAKRNEEEKCQL